MSDAKEQTTRLFGDIANTDNEDGDFNDKICRYCDYFDAECCQRSLKRFEKVLHKKNKSKSSKLYSMFAILQCHALKVL